jgi:hypothetical protein
VVIAIGVGALILLGLILSALHGLQRQNAALGALQAKQADSLHEIRDFASHVSLVADTAAESLREYERERDGR